MSDYVMSNKNSMTEAQIQQFLTNKNPCNDRNIGKASQYPNMVYNIKDGKFVCLSNEVFNGETAAKIIWQAAQDYNINPQVLIVLLQKEQGLVTDTWPNHNVQYRSATGYGCPDNADCNSKYYGFKNQVRNAANFFRAHLDNNSGWYKPHVPGGQNVRWNPNTSCGAGWVNIENRATSGLYSYTPYQPNGAALRAGYGTGDGCSAYGNRNFWAYFNDWFGSTQGDGFVSLDDPRWMQINIDTQKINSDNLMRFGPTINTGAQAKFIDKIKSQNDWIARTKWDYSNKNKDGFMASELGEINFEQITPVWMVVNKNTNKLDPLRETTHEFTQKNTFLKFVDKVTVNNETYYRTEWEANQKRSRSYKLEDLSPPSMSPFISPRIMVAKKDISKINFVTQEQASTLEKNSMYFFNKLIYLNDKLYAQMATDSGTNLVVDSAFLGEVDRNPFKPFIDPRIMEVSSPTYKYNIATKETVGSILNTGNHLEFVDQITVNNIWYARTKSDSENNKLIGIPVSSLKEVAFNKHSFVTTLKNDSYKIDPVRGIKYENLRKGAKATIVDKVIVNGKTYYRTDWEHSQGRPRFIPATDLY